MSERVKSVVSGLAPRLSSGRTALFLYVLLVVLPAVVFGALLWRQTQQEQERVLAALPEECKDAARRLAETCARRAMEKLDFEFNRGFELYQENYYVDGLGPIQSEPSPLVSAPRRKGILGWFSFRATGSGAGAVAGPTQIDVFRGREASRGAAGAPGSDPIAQLIEEVVRDELATDLERELRPATSELERAALDGWGETRSRRLRTVLLNIANGPVEECQSALDERPELYEDARHEVHVSYFQFRVVKVDDSGPPMLLAYRRVVMPQLAAPIVESCFEAISRDLMYVQGVVYDPSWLYTTMPKEVASQVLGSSLQFLPPGFTLGNDPDLFFALDNLIRFLDIEGDVGLDTLSRGTMFVAGDAGARRGDFRVQNAWFGGVALVLMISMTIGIRLLLSSIRRSRQEAERTRNFVASVTHELRTPIAAVKLYGEMLSDGWIKDEEKRSDYLKRIVAESDRLDGLVDRVLLRRRLSDRDHAPSAGSLNAEVEQLRPSLEMVGGRAADDIEFDLTKDLPNVLLLPEGVHVILTNLVENARKYAPVTVGPDDAPGEPILVRTRGSRKGRVLLEVLDRGPGISEEDRDRVFEAFLRLGDEATRKTKGTGLGLHLVALQARAMRAKVRALPRSGGGTIFQVIFAKG